MVLLLVLLVAVLVAGAGGLLCLLVGVQQVTTMSIGVQQTARLAAYLVACPAFIIRYPVEGCPATFLGPCIPLAPVSKKLTLRPLVFGG